MNWLITGGCGFIGRALIERLLQEGGHQIRVLDNLTVGSREDLALVTQFEDLGSQALSAAWASTPGLVEGDIRDAKITADAAQGADVIIHLAANTGVGPSVEDPRADCESNVFGTLNMLEAARAAKTPRFVFASSGAPLGVQNPPLHEELAPHPASPYGASKLAGEGYLSAYYHSFGVNTVGLRFGNVYGEGSGHKQSVVAKFIKLAMAGETLELYGDGTQTRDFIHISDLVEAIYQAAHVEGIGGELFQIATARETTVSELTEVLLDVMEDCGIARPAIIYGPKRTGDVMRNFSDTTKAKERMDWQAQVALTDGLKRTVLSFTETAGKDEH